LALGNSGTGKTHVALALGLAACQKGFSVAFTTAAALVNQLLEARDERRLLKLQHELQSVKLLIIDELGYVPLSSTGAELLFETFSQRYERGSTIVTSNLPFEDWTSILGSERLTGALLDRLPPRQHPDHEWRQLPPAAIRQPPPPTRGGAKPGHRRAHQFQYPARSPPPDQETGWTCEGAQSGPFACPSTVPSMACFYSATLAWNCSAVDIGGRRPPVTVVTVSKPAPPGAAPDEASDAALVVAQLGALIGSTPAR
jgi:hypothetical protein